MHDDDDDDNLRVFSSLIFRGWSVIQKVSFRVFKPRRLLKSLQHVGTHTGGRRLKRLKVSSKDAVQTRNPILYNSMFA
jgi:hypothetical protein